MYSFQSKSHERDTSPQCSVSNKPAVQFKDQRGGHTRVNETQGLTEESPRMQAQTSRFQQIFNPIKQQINRTGLPDRLKSGLERLSGFSMNDVRVHYNSHRPKGFHAHAYTQGTEIHIGPGQERYVPHEAWHVVQQKQGRVKPTTQFKGSTSINDSPQLEREADLMGVRALSQGHNPHPETGANHSIITPVLQAKWIATSGTDHMKWDKPIGDQEWFYNPDSDKMYYISISSGDKSGEFSYLEWLNAGWPGLETSEINTLKTEVRKETPPERRQRQRNQKYLEDTGKPPHDAMVAGGFTAGDLVYGPQKERIPYLFTSAVEIPGRKPNLRHKIVNPYNAAWYPSDIKEKIESKHQTPRTWEEARENAVHTSGKAKDKAYMSRSALKHLEIFRSYYNKPGENDVFPIKDDTNAERDKGWRRGSKAGIRNTVKEDNQQIHFVLDGLNLKDVFDKTEKQATSVTSTELRFIYRNWRDADYRNRVKFYKNNQLVPAPWDDPEKDKHYRAEELKAMSAYKPKSW